MPDAASQVYWHNIPDAPPPWKSELEHKQMLHMARRIPGRISSQRHLLALPRDKFVVLRQRKRNRPPTKPRHWGIVLEPNLSPLLGLNMIMDELQVDPITRDEAMVAVTTVRNDYLMMTQQTFSQSNAHKSMNAMSQSSTQQGAPTTAMDMREAPLLEVVKIFCEARKLDVHLMSKAELLQQRRISYADVTPHRRVIMAVDRSSPRFVFALAVPDSPSRPDRARFLQVIAPTSTPVPWRRILRGGMRSLPPSECVVVAIQRSEGAGETGNLTLSGVSKDMDCDDDTPQRKIMDVHHGSCTSREGSVNDSLSSDASDDLTEHTNMARLMDKPIFSVNEKIEDDPIFLTPTAVLRRHARRADRRHDWIQRLIESDSRQQLYALNVT